MVSDILTQLYKYYKANKYFLLIVFLMFIAIFSLNRFYPLIYDDWGYTFMMDGKPIHGLIDIINNQYHHYMTWGGRSIVHGILQIILQFGELSDDIIMSLIYVVLVLLIYSITNFKKKHNHSLLILINIILWFILPNFSENILWTTGAANYLLGTTIIVAFIYKYIQLYYQDSNELKKTSSFAIIGYFIFGVVAGWTNENMALALLFFLFILMIFVYKKQRKKIPKWAIIGFVGAIIGTIILILAPGNFIRAKALDEICHHYSANTNHLKDLWHIILHFIQRYLYYYLALMAIFFWLGNKKATNNIWRLSLLFWLTSLVAALVMLPVVNAFSARVWFGISIFFILALGTLYANFDFTKSKVKKIINILVLIGLIFMVFSYSFSLKSLIIIRKFVDKRESEIIKQRNEGKKGIIVYGHFHQKKSALIRTKIKDFPYPMSKDELWRYEAYTNFMKIGSIEIKE